MKKENKSYRKTGIILGSSICAAAWLIGGPDILLNWGIDGTANDLLTWTPAMVAFFGSIAGDKEKLDCERRAFKRLIGR